MTLKELREKQAELVTQARAKLEEIKADTPEARAREIEAEYDAMMSEYDRLEARAKREETLAEREAAINAPDPRRPGGEERTADGRERQVDVDINTAFRRAMQFGMDGLEMPERRAVANLRADLTPEMRAQSTSATAGGYTIPQGFLAEIERALVAYGPMLDPGITRVLTTDSGNTLPWPTVDDTSNVGALLAENTQATQQDVVFGQKSLGAYTYTSKIVLVSIQLLQDSAFSMDGLLNELFGERLGRICNTHLTTGDGTGKPSGIVTGSTLGKTAASATAIAADELLDMAHAVDPAYRSSPNFRWMFNDDTLKVIRKLKDGQGNYLWQLGDIKGGQPATLLSHPYTINQAMASVATATKPIIIGDFNKYIVRRVRDYTMMRLTERYADYLQVGFLAFNRIDGVLSQPAAVKHLIMA